MERYDNLYLSKDIFFTLLNELISKFKSNYTIKDYKDTQLYGFGSYDPNKPSLKTDLEKLCKDYINGKYLYNKMREAASGVPSVRISKDYQYIYFLYLGYENIHDFLNKSIHSEEQKNKQLELLNSKKVNQNYYYTCYCLCEDFSLNKGELIIYNNWKTLEMKFHYKQNNGEKEIYSFMGNVVHSENFVHFNTKFFIENRKIEGAKFIFFVGKSNPSQHNCLIGTYAGFDKYNKAVAGKIILKKAASREEVHQEIQNDYFDPIICQKLYKKRIIIENKVEKTSLLFSKKDPYAQLLFEAIGKYTLDFYIEDNVKSLNLEILPYTYKIISLDTSTFVSNSNITATNNWQVLFIDLLIEGFFPLKKVSIYVKLFNSSLMKNKTDNMDAKFNGVDINSNIVSGKVVFNNLVAETVV